jgi:hypothetical protein
MLSRKGHKGDRSALSFSPDGRTPASVNGGGASACGTPSQPRSGRHSTDMRGRHTRSISSWGGKPAILLWGLEDAGCRTSWIEAAPDRRAFPNDWQLNLKKRPGGRLIYLRRSNSLSEVTLLGQSWPLDQVWPNRLARREVDLDKDKIRFCSLRRKAPTSQPRILEADYRLPNRGLEN